MRASPGRGDQGQSSCGKEQGGGGSLQGSPGMRRGGQGTANEHCEDGDAGIRLTPSSLLNQLGVTETDVYPRLTANLIT